MEDERLGEVGSALRKASKSKSRSTGGGPLQFMANPIKHCKECVLKAVEADGNALQHADSLREQTRKSFWQHGFLMLWRTT
jgi:hypothetical protein